MALNLNQTQSPQEGFNSRMAIECSPAVLEQILAHVEEGFYSVPHGGAEMGGVLYGAYDGSRILIQAAVPLLCEHADGPSFNLSHDDYSRLTALLDAPEGEPDLAGMTVVGWYHSPTRSEISFTAADIQTHERFFPKPWQVALVLKPSAMKPTEVGLFVKGADGAMRRSAQAAEDSLTLRPIRTGRAQPNPDAAAAPLAFPRGNRQAAAATPQRLEAIVVPASAEAVPPPLPDPAEEEQSEAPAAPGKTRWFWAVTAALVLMTASLGGYVAMVYWPSRAAPGASRLELHAADRNGLLEITWDGNLPALRQSRGGSLEISDGQHLYTLPMDAEFLRRGSISYERHSGVVTVQMAVMLKDGSELHQQMAFVGDQAAEAQQPPALQAMPEPAPSLAPEVMKPVTQSGSLPGRATGAPAYEATARQFVEPSSSSATAAAIKPLPPPPAASGMPSPVEANRLVAQTIQLPAPTLPTPVPSPAPSLARAEPRAEPAAAAPALSGRWTFGRTSPSGSPFPPESVTLSVSQNGSMLQGYLAGRYRTPKSAGLKPDILFSFQGPVHAGNMRFLWAASDGRKGTVELIRLPNRSDSLEVVWYADDRKFVFDDVLVRVAK